MAEVNRSTPGSPGDTIRDRVAVNRSTPGSPGDTIRDRVAEEVNEGFTTGTKKFVDSVIPTIKSMTSRIYSGMSYMSKGVVSIFESMKCNLSDFTNKITTGFRTAINTVTSSVTSILGNEVMEVVELIKGIMTGVFTMLKGMFGFIYGGISKLFTGGSNKKTSSDAEKEQVGILRSIKDWISKLFHSNEEMEEGINSLVKHNKDDLKRRAREKPEKEEKGIGKIIIAILALIAGTIVGYLSRAFKPFSALGGLIAPFKKGGAVFTLFSKVIPQKLTFLGKIGKMFSNVITKIGNVFRNIAKMPGIGRIFSIGKVFGAFLFYIRAAWGIFKELRDGSKDLRDRILGISAVITELLLEIPQMIVNGLLSLFGSDFRVDFSKEAIIEAVNGITDWVFDNVTKPVLDFFLITLPGIWKNFKSKFFNIVDFSKEAIINAMSNVTDWIFDNVTKPVLDFFLITLPDTLTKFKYKFFNLVNYLKDIPIRIDNWIKGLISDIGEGINTIIENVKSGITNLISDIKEWIQKVFDTIMNPFRKYIIDPLKKLWEWFTGTPDHSIVDAMFVTIYNIVQKVFDVISWPFRKFIIDPINKVIEWIQGFLDSDESVFDNVKSALSTIFEIPGKILDWITGVIPSWDDIKEWVANKIPKRVARWLGIGKDKGGDDEKADDMTVLDGFDPTIWDRVLESLIGIKDNSIKMLENVVKVPELLVSMMEYFRLLFEENMLKNMFTSIVEESKNNFKPEEKESLRTEKQTESFTDDIRRDEKVNMGPQEEKIPESVYQETILQYLSTIVSMLGNTDGKNNGNASGMISQTNINSSGGGQGGGRNTEGDNPDQVENFGLMMLTSTAVGSDY